MHTLEVLRSGELTGTEVSEFDATDNLVVSVHRMASAYREMSVCKHCRSGELQLYNTGTWLQSECEELAELAKILFLLLAFCCYVVKLCVGMCLKPTAPEVSNGK